MLEPWVVYSIRLENEHLNNVGKYRAFKSVPLPFSYYEIDNDDDDDNNDDDKNDWASTQINTQLCTKAMIETPCFEDDL